MADLLTYEPTQRFDTQNGLYGNHFKFVIEALPDISFFAQTVTLPSVMSSSPGRPNPFTKIKEVGDHLEYGTLTVNYLIDAHFKTYSSLLWWVQGYGFPHSYDEVKLFREARARRLPYPHIQTRNIEKTMAVLYVLEPDTERVIVEIQFTDVFPIQLGEFEFASTYTDPPLLTCTANFAYTVFDVVPHV